MKLIHVTCCLLMVGWATATFASSDALLNKLVQKGVLTQEEANQLRKDLDKEEAQTADLYAKTKVASWIEEMRWSSDLRLRYEFIDNADQAGSPAKSDRTRFRYKLRLGLETKFQEWAKIGLRFATGGEDPVSITQSMQDTFSRKEFRIDLAYVTLMWPCTDFIAITGGMMPNPIWQPAFNSPMEYDFDLNPEGLAEQIQWRFGNDKRFRLFGNFGQFVLDEISADENDPYLLEFQGGIEANLGGEDPKKPIVKVTAAGGYAHTYNMELIGVAAGTQPAGSATPSAQSTSANRGNATRQPGGAGTTLFYLDDFDIIYGRGEVAWTLCKDPFLQTPAMLTFAAEYIHNFANDYDKLSGSTQTQSPGQTDGWTVQVAFGSNKKRGEWRLAYQYKYLEADAVWDAVTDSDFGLGGTDREGHILRASYNVRDWWQLGFAGFITEKISSRPNSGENTRGKADSALLRVQADTVFKF